MSKLPLQVGSQVLDVGSGLGGTVEYMAKVMKYHCDACLEAGAKNVGCLLLFVLYMQVCAAIVVVKFSSFLCT